MVFSSLLEALNREVPIAIDHLHGDLELQQAFKKKGQKQVLLELIRSLSLTLDFLVAVVNSINTKTHCWKEMAEFCFKNANVKSICCCKQRAKGKLSLSSECVEMKLCKLCTSVTSHLHSSCGMVWYWSLRVKAYIANA